MNKALYCVLAAGIIFLSGCGANPTLDFQPDEEGIYHAPQDQIDRWARTIVKSPDIRARELLDMGYMKADSLSAGDPGARTLEAFARDVAHCFLDLGSPLYNEHAYEMALDREAQCANWTSWGRRGTDWRRSILNNNRPGTRVCDFWLSGGAPRDTLLRELLPEAPVTVLFLYGESCETCEKMIQSISRNRSFPRLAADRKAQFISIYTGEDTEEYKEKSARLPSYWQNWYDRENVVMYDRAFDTRMIPSLYVIDNKETVLLRGQTKVNETVKFLHSK